MLIAHPAQAFIVKVYVHGQPRPKAGPAILKGTLYKEEGAFIQAGTYFFEAVTKYFEPVAGDISLADFKAAAAFYFKKVLQTELFVIGIPEASIPLSIAAVCR